MTASIWTAYAERLPTKEDLDADGGYLVTDGTIVLWAKATHSSSKYGMWCRTADVLRATGYTKPRKLHSAWRELRADSWSGTAKVWLYTDGMVLSVQPYETPSNAIKNGWTHWQPCDPPPVWEDE